MLNTKFNIIKKAKLVLVLFAFLAFWGTISAQDCGGIRNPNLDRRVGECPWYAGGIGRGTFPPWGEVIGSPDAYCRHTDYHHGEDISLSGTPPFTNYARIAYSEGSNIEAFGQRLTKNWVAGGTYRVSFDITESVPYWNPSRVCDGAKILVVGFRGPGYPSVPINEVYPPIPLYEYPGWEILGIGIENTNGNNDVKRMDIEFTISHEISYIAISMEAECDYTGGYCFDNFCVTRESLKPPCFESEVILSGLDDGGCPVDILSDLIIKNGDGVIPSGTHLTFYDGDPREAGATKLGTYTTTADIAANATEKLGDIPIGACIVNNDFLYVVLGDDGSNTVPLDLSNPLANPTYDDCDYTDNISLIKLKKPCYPFESIDKEQ